MRVAAMGVPVLGVPAAPGTGPAPHPVTGPVR